ncbi:hypothetical protein RDV64_02755 [Acuticoccus sp. MNP-M23]|uniref:hypothetical protein n=1 Tax=Acuticoccus sp. MNP-M23 TaxID=3072793 RepID=UPI00281573CA|nr:hypothetical protein [Acuticoccus sp. MNP-M23]WMS43341.1 hypothetical protein RDV64_02755 [Acuticoccus sp. MNP-M23]
MTDETEYSGQDEQAPEPPEPRQAAAPATVDAAALARRLDVPSTVLSFLEGQFPEIRALKADGRRRYRATDAVLLAGLVDALYGEGRAFREVQQELRSGAGRQRLAARGAALIGRPPETQQAPASAIPPDAVVRRKGPMPHSPPQRPSSPTADAILRELMACVRVLEAARAEDT